MNFRISGQRIQPKSSVKYLGLVIDEFLNWKTGFTILRAKLEKSTDLLAKLRYFISANLSVYSRTPKSKSNFFWGDILLIWLTATIITPGVQ